MTCPKCNKLAYEREVATKTREVDGHVVVLAKRRALVCDKHGVLAWDPPTQTINPVPYVPQPLMPPPWQPQRIPSYPFGGAGSGGVSGAGSPRPYNVCSTSPVG